MRYKTAVAESSNPNFYWPHLGIPPEKCFGDEWCGASIIDASYNNSYDGELMEIQFLLHPRWEPNSIGINEACLMAIALFAGQPDVGVHTLESHDIYSIEDVLNVISIQTLQQAGIIMIARPLVPVNYYLPSYDEGSYMISAPYIEEDDNW